MTAQGSSWRGKTGEVIDINIMTDPRHSRPILQVLVQLDHYDANAPFPSRWFPYLDILYDFDRSFTGCYALWFMNLASFAILPPGRIRISI